MTRAVFTCFFRIKYVMHKQIVLRGLPRTKIALQKLRSRAKTNMLKITFLNT